MPAGKIRRVRKFYIKKNNDREIKVTKKEFLKCGRACGISSGATNGFFGKDQNGTVRGLIRI